MAPEQPRPSRRARPVSTTSATAHYDGPRLGRAYARRSLYSQSLRGAYGLGRSAKSKVLPMLLFAVMCVPAAIMVAVAVATKAKELPVEYTRYAIIMQAVIGLYVASQAPQSVSRDLRFKTVPLYFSRPIETADYVRAKFAALASALFILTAAPLVVLYVGALLAKLDFADQTKGFAQGLVSVALLSLLFAGIGLVIAARHPAPRLRHRGRHRRTDHLLRRGLHRSRPSPTRRAAPAPSPGSASSRRSRSSTACRRPSSAPPPPSPARWAPAPAQGVVYLLVVLGLIAGCYGLLMRRYRKVGL